MEFFQQLFALILLDISGNDCRRYAIALQVFPDTNRGVLGIGEDDAALRL